MLHIILTVLKIIAILILILLFVLLFLLFAILAAPVKYELFGGWKGKLDLHGTIHWLYRMVRISIVTKNGKPELSVSILGRGKRAKSRQKKKTADDSPSLDLDPAAWEDKQEEKKESDLIQKEISESEIREKERKNPEIGEEKKTAPEIEREEKNALEIEREKKTTSEIGKEENTNWEKEQVDLEESEIEDFKTETDWDRLLDEAEQSFEEMDAEMEEPESEKNGIWELLQQIVRFLQEPSVKKEMGCLWRTIRSLIRHLRPSDLYLRARVGMDDPALTGKIMEVASVLYAFYGDHIDVSADFEEKVLEADFTVKGKLVPGYLIIKILWMALRILRNRDCRAFYREMKQKLA